MKPRINIPALFQAVVDKVATNLNRPVYFDYGKLKEVARKLTQLDGGITTGDKKYPLVWLVMNYAETYGNMDEFCALDDITIMICTLTDISSYTSKRISTNFIPTLYPIYDALISRTLVYLTSNIQRLIVLIGMKIYLVRIPITTSSMTR